MTLILDAGALVAVERHSRDTAAVIDAARRQGRRVVVPAGVVAQVWRDGARQAMLSRLLGAPGLTVEALTYAEALAVGTLCGATRTADVVDASVVIAARRHRGTVLSSDRVDLEALDPTVRVVDC